MEDLTSEEAYLDCLVRRHRVEHIRSHNFRRGCAWDRVAQDFRKLTGKSMQPRMTVNGMTELKPCNVPQETKFSKRT